jgi:hypothetical protein
LHRPFDIDAIPTDSLQDIPIHPNTLENRISGVNWRRGAGIVGKKSPRKLAPAFVPVALPAPAHAAPVAGADHGLIEIELAGGCRIRVTGQVEMEALRRVIAALNGR